MASIGMHQIDNLSVLTRNMGTELTSQSGGDRYGYYKDIFGTAIPDGQTIGMITWATQWLSDSCNLTTELSTLGEAAGMIPPKGKYGYVMGHIAFTAEVNMHGVDRELRWQPMALDFLVYPGAILLSSASWFQPDADVDETAQQAITRTLDELEVTEQLMDDGSFQSTELSRKQVRHLVDYVLAQDFTGSQPE